MKFLLATSALATVASAQLFPGPLPEVNSVAVGALGTTAAGNQIAVGAAINRPTSTTTITTPLATTLPPPATTLPYTSVTTLPYTPVTTATIARPVATGPPPPPRFLTGPGIQVAGYPDLPPTYDFPYEQTQIDTNTGLLIRTSGTPLPPIENLVKWSDGNWYQAPTNAWEYRGSPLQPYNDANSPFHLREPGTWALLVNDNSVNLSTGEVFNNPYTPIPTLEVRPIDNVAYAVPRDPFQFMESPLQPYNYPDAPVDAKPTQIPPMVPAGEIGFKQGYNPETIDILKEIQRLNLNYNYDLNGPSVGTEQQVGIVGIPGVPVP